VKGDGNATNCSRSNCSSNGGRTIIMSKTEAVTIAMSTAETIEQIPATSAARRRPSRQKEIGTRHQGWCPKQSEPVIQPVRTIGQFQVNLKSCRVNSTTLKKKRIGSPSSKVTCYDGKTDRRTKKVHEPQGEVLQLRNVNKLPGVGA
jgi:hypothetical protein